MNKFFSLAVLLMLAAMSALAQVLPTPNPIPKGYTDEIVLTFDPTKGNGGMAKATECYSHIGLITSESATIQDWKYIKDSNWGKKTEPQWTKVGDKWQLTIPNMYSWFGCPSTTDIKYIVMVFHDGNGDASKQGKTSKGGDILVYVGEETPDEDDIWANFTPAAVQTQSRPAGIDMGIYYGEDGTSVTLCTFVAGCKTANDPSVLEPAEHVFLIGDMTDWKLSNDYQLKRDGNYFWIKLTGLTKGKEYRFQYAVIRSDGAKKQISDLYSEKVIHPDDNYEPRTLDPDLIGYPMTGADGGYVTVIQPGKPKFEWSQETLNFQRPDKNNLVIYETWVRDHTHARSWQGMLERLDYFQNLGINCLELMPITEFDGNENWGYSPNHYFAVDKAYGNPEKLKVLIDECHKRGIAVVLDMVFNHATGLNPMNKLYPYGKDLKFNPWFNVNAPHPDNVYEDWNHDFEPAHNMFIRALKYWIEEYKVDGYRMDLSHGLCGKKYNAYDNLKDYYTKAIQPYGAYFILEHWGDSAYVECPKLVNDGMLCWANTCEPFQQMAMGWMTDNDNLNPANNDGYVSYCESHDEERCFFKAKQWGDGVMKSDEAVRVARIPAVVGFQCLLNGPQMFYHFAELGFDNSKFQNKEGIWGSDGVKAYGASVATPSVSYEVKMKEKLRPEEQGWFAIDGIRMKAYKKLGQAIQLRTRIMPEVFAGNPTKSSLGSGLYLRTIQWGNDVFVAANFSASSAKAATLPSGTWYDYYTGATVSGSANVLPGELKIFTSTKVDLPDFVANIADLSTFEGDKKCYKLLLDGRIIIVRDGQMFDLTGRNIK